MANTTLQFLWQDSGVGRRFGAAVSLHSHTCHSWESLRWLAGFQSHWPALPFVLRLAGWQHRRATGKKLDLARTFWTPPLHPVEALRLEAKQIHDLGLPALVSLTDHDDLESGFSLLLASDSRSAPVSLEWTVPFGPTFFHLGVHNLPPARAREIAAHLYAYTAEPSATRLKEVLDLLNQLPDTLLILNHPLWDEAGIGLLEHTNTLELLLSCCAGWIHALELNGLRSWGENRYVLDLAAA